MFNVGQHPKDQLELLVLQPPEQQEEPLQGPPEEPLLQERRNRRLHEEQRQHLWRILHPAYLVNIIHTVIAAVSTFALMECLYRKSVVQIYNGVKVN